MLPIAEFGRLAGKENQTSCAQAEYAGKKKQTRCERFLSEMKSLVPWARLAALIVPFYPRGERGRPHMGIEKMRRVCFLQQGYGLADEALEDALSDSQALRTFVGIDSGGGEAVPDATALLGLRHLRERHELTKAIFAQVNVLLSEWGVLLREGTLVDATIIAAPCSTKNKAKARDPEMHQTRKGRPWYFGMKAHAGVDADSGVVPTVTGAAANVAGIAEVHRLLHGQEKRGQGDSGDTGVGKRAESLAMFPHVRWQIAAKRGKNH